MGGTLHIDSTRTGVGIGSTFVINLSLAEQVVPPLSASMELPARPHDPLSPTIVTRLCTFNSTDDARVPELAVNQVNITRSIPPEQQFHLQPLQPSFFEPIEIRTDPVVQDSANETDISSISNVQSHHPQQHPCGSYLSVESHWRRRVSNSSCRSSRLTRSRPSLVLLSSNMGFIEDNAENAFDVEKRKLSRRSTNCSISYANHCGTKPTLSANFESTKFDQFRVLIVDDSAVGNLLMVRILRSLGFKSVTQATNGDIALQICTESPEFHLILTDLYMPGIDGMQLAMAIRKNNSNNDNNSAVFQTTSTPPLGDMANATCDTMRVDGKQWPVIIILSGTVEQNMTHVCAQAGADAFISKPITRTQVLDLTSLWLLGRKVAETSG
jgi:CheY-like chemotaxis protein